MDVDEHDDEFELGSSRSTPAVLKNKPKRKRTSRACSNCARAHLSCCDRRPCDRCVASGRADSCKDGRRKRRGRKRKTATADDDEDDESMIDMAIDDESSVSTVRLSISPGSGFASAEISDDEPSPRISPKYMTRRAAASSLPSTFYYNTRYSAQQSKSYAGHSLEFASAHTTPSVNVISSSWQGSSLLDSPSRSTLAAPPTTTKDNTDDIFDMDEDIAASQLLQFKFSHSLPDRPQFPLHSGSHTKPQPFVIPQTQYQPMQFGVGSAPTQPSVQRSAPVQVPNGGTQSVFVSNNSHQAAWSAPDVYSGVQYAAPVSVAAGSLL